MLKKILISVAALITVLAVIGFLLPRQSHIERSIVIDRPASMVFGVVNSFKLFPRWSPWQHLDPGMTQTASGPADGVGATLQWAGNDKIGTGKQVIIASTPYESVASDLSFGDMGTSKAVMHLSSDGKSTTLRWSLDTDMGAGPVGRYFGLMMDSMVGKDFDAGLKNLKTLLESMPNADIAGFDAKVVDLQAQPVLLVSKSTASDPAAVSKAYADAYGEIGKFMAANHLQQAGAPFGIDQQMTDTTLSFDAGMPVSTAVTTPADGAVRAGSSYAGRALLATHVGSYDTLRGTYQKLAAFSAVHGFDANGATFSRYVDDPMKTPLNQLRTEVYWPVK